MASRRPPAPPPPAPQGWHMEVPPGASPTVVSLIRKYNNEVFACSAQLNEKHVPTEQKLALLWAHVDEEIKAALLVEEVKAEELRLINQLRNLESNVS